MTDRKQALTDLLEKVEAEGDITLGEASIVDANDIGLSFAQAYNGSLDAANALHKAVLPLGFWALIDTDGVCDVHDPQGGLDHSEPIGMGVACSPARAWLIAILKALIAQEASDGT